MRFSQLALWGLILGAKQAEGLDALQTGPGTGSSYASSLMTDGTGNIYMVGSTYDPNLDKDAGTEAAYAESSCFVLSWQMWDGPIWEDRKIIGTPNVMESCHATGLINPQTLVLVGNSEPNGLYADPSNTMTGWASIVDKEKLEPLRGGVFQMEDPDDIPYPISVVSDGTGVYVIALTTTDSQPSEHYSRVSNTQFPNWIQYEKYGSSFDMTVMKFNYEQPVDDLGIELGDPTLQRAWHKEFPFNPENNGRVPRVYLSGMLLKNNNYLIVAGSTFGKGDGYGNARGQDEDGFITLIDPVTGELDAGQHNQRRIGSAADDLVTGMCDNPEDPNTFFIVGATEGDVGGVQEDQLNIVSGSRQAFVMKIDVTDLSTVWTLQVGAVKGSETTQAYALNCVVDGGAVYLAGEVLDGAGMVKGYSVEESKGGYSDIWVAKIDDEGNQYELKWIQQVGTDGKDQLARYGGIAIDGQGNPIIYGDTTGSMARDRGVNEETTDIFFKTISKNYNMPEGSPPPVGAPVAPPTEGSVGVESPTGIEGVQSGPGVGSVYASGMIFDGTDEIYIVGNTYDGGLVDGAAGAAAFEQSSCFVASIDLDDWNNGVYELEDAKIFGDAGVLESCHGLGLIAPATLMLAGNSEPGGLYSSGNPAVKMSGFAATMDKNFFGINSGLTFEMSDSKKIPFPMSIATDGTGAAYIMALTSTDDDLSQHGSAANQAVDPNWIEYEKYGTSYDMTIMKVEYTESDDPMGFGGSPDLRTLWKKEYPINAEANGVVPRVYLGGLFVKTLDDARVLIVAGSTRGLGDGYGCAEGDDEDGFVSLFDLDSGDLYQPQMDERRIGSDKDDIITGVCDNPDDPNSFYVVGATRGDMGGIQDGTADLVPEDSLQAFIRKIKVHDLRPDWTLQLGAVKGGEKTTAFAVDCVAANGQVYVAGNVKDGAGMVRGTDVLDSNGGDDIWIARIKDHGKKFDVRWYEQFGTSGNDNIARFGGIVMDGNGDAIVYGDTTGSMFRDRVDDDDVSDIFVMRLAQHEFAAPTKPPVPNQSPVAPVSQPTLAPVLPPTMAPHEHVEIGVQYAGPLYAGGVAYDSSLDRSMITGATYASGGTSNCFVATISMNSGDMLSREDFGNNPTNEACSAISFSSFEDAAYIAGGTEQNGFLTGGASVDPDVVQYGMILQVTDRSQLAGYGFEDSYPVQYPVAVVSDPNGDYIYVASMVSDDSNQSWSPEQDGETFPDLTSGGDFKYGSLFYMVVERYQVQQGQEGSVDRVINRDWYKEFKFDGNDQSLGDIMVSSMVMAGGGNQLVVTGSTRQSGGPFGNNDGTDEDGWIIKLDVATGGLYTGEGSTRSSIRVDDASQDDDWISAVCVDRFDQDSIYIVGASNEPTDNFPEGSLHAFVAKINLNGLTRVWRVHLPMVAPPDGSPPEAGAIGCAVAPDSDGGKVYVVGNIMGGAMMKDAEEGMPHGEDDIFIVQFDASNGDIEWVRQVGTERGDTLARGDPITLDADGNAIVFGNTYGSMYYYRDDNTASSDVFLMTFSKLDGSYKAILSQGGNPHSTPDDLTGDTEINSADSEEYDFNYVPDNIFALQTGPDVGPSYAGGMVYDRFSNAVYVTGATYGSFSGPGIEATPVSSCFFGVIILPRMQWKERETYGTRDAAEACSALALTKFGGNDKAIVIGSTEENGLLTRLGSNQATQYGFAMDLANSNGKYELVGGALMDENKIQYPLAVLAEDEQVWIVSMASKDSEVTADFDKVANNEYPNLTTGGIEKYGSKYSIVMEKHNMISSVSSVGAVEEQTLDLVWRKPFEAADMESVFVSGLLRINEELVIVGSTRGSPGGNEMDGLMAKVSTADGSFAFDGPSGRSVAYFSSVTGRDDWILNACSDPDDDKHFFVVGATKGRIDPNVSKDKKDLTVHAVMAKISLDTLTSVWTKQYTVLHSSGRTDKEAAAVALGCDVISGEGLMYVAGVVENGASIQYDGQMEEQHSAGGDDIFVSLVSTKDGTTRWLKQVGSNGDDRVARGGGVKVDGNKNAVVFGDTTGSFYRTRNQDVRPSDSDIFVVLFDFRDGRHLPPLVAPPIASTTTEPPKEWYYETSNKSKLLAFGITALVLLAVAFICCIICRNRQRRKLDAQKTSIFTYLQQFDVEDIDLRKSPPGGWHGTYLNKLAYGINDGEASHATTDTNGGGETYETAPLTHSSVVNDSLFMDNEASPTLGYEDQPYDDLKPRTYEDEDGRIKARDII